MPGKHSLKTTRPVFHFKLVVTLQCSAFCHCWKPIIYDRGVKMQRPKVNGTSCNKEFSPTSSLLQAALQALLASEDFRIFSQQVWVCMCFPEGSELPEGDDSLPPLLKGVVPLVGCALLVPGQNIMVSQPGASSPRWQETEDPGQSVQCYFRAAVVVRILLRKSRGAVTKSFYPAQWTVLYHWKCPNS